MQVGGGGSGPHGGAPCVRPRVRFLLDRGDDLQEAAQIRSGDAPHDRLLERRQLPQHGPCDDAATTRERDLERPSIGGADRPRDQSARLEPIEDARQGRTLMGEAGVQAGDGRGRGRRQQRQDVRLALR